MIVLNRILITIACLLYPLNHFIAAYFNPLYETMISDYDAYINLRYKLITIIIGASVYVTKFFKEDKYIYFVSGIILSFCISDLVSRYIFNENNFELKKDLFSILLILIFEFYKVCQTRMSKF